MIGCGTLSESLASLVGHLPLRDQKHFRVSGIEGDSLFGKVQAEVWINLLDGLDVLGEGLPELPVPAGDIAAELILEADPADRCDPLQAVETGDEPQNDIDLLGRIGEGPHGADVDRKGVILEGPEEFLVHVELVVPEHPLSGVARKPHVERLDGLRADGSSLVAPP